MLPEGVEAEAVMNRLDREGLCVSAGSACHAGLIEPSRVLTAMGLSAGEAFRVLRLSLGWGNDAAEMARAMDLVVASVEQVRRG
jgi:cysteine desulfurase